NGAYHGVDQSTSFWYANGGAVRRNLRKALLFISLRGCVDGVHLEDLKSGFRVHMAADVSSANMRKLKTYHAPDPPEEFDPEDKPDWWYM
ncbi:hypothetical protein LTR22_026254, partial [Elasticomyces elasticus]